MSELEKKIIHDALEEDAGRGDVTTAASIDPGQRGKTYFLAKADGILSGIDVAGESFLLYAERTSRKDKVTFEKKAADGASITKGRTLATLDAPLDIILTAERVALNFMQRMSGIATMTREFVNAVAGTNAIILDTRKTAPLLRPFDRYAVVCGGGKNHRYALDDMILVKDNHIAANKGDVLAVVKKLQEYFKKNPKIPVEIEVTSLDQFKVLLENGKGLVDRVMFDNFSLEKLREGVAMNSNTFEIEASGGVNLSTVRAIAETGVDFISVGALTHSVTGLDISLEISGGM
jgi:nicotinate-nucleotide pyrophosphorylase (carboxylating)